MMTAGAPAWGQWTTFYDSAGQVPSMTRYDSEDGLVVTFGMVGLQLYVGGDQDAPFAGAMGLSGSLSVSMPDNYPLQGFVLMVRGVLVKSLHSEAAVSCSIGHSTKSIEWPRGGISGPEDPGPDAGEETLPEGSLTTSFQIPCFLTDVPPSDVLPRLPALPITISTQIRRRFVDEFASLTIDEVEVVVVR